MTKIRSWVALALAVALLMVPGAGLSQTTGGYYYWWTVVDERNQPFTGENVQCSVFRPNTHAAAVIHTTSALTTGGNSPLFSDANGKLHFYGNFNSPVDVNCYYAGGGMAQINKFRISDHKIVLPRQGGGISRFSVNSVSATYQTDSGIVIPGGALIKDVIIQNLNPRGLGTYHLSIGFLGNHSVANAAALVHTVGLSSPDEWIRPHVQYSFTQQIRGVAGNHRGLALSDFALRHSEGAGNMGWYVEKPYIVHVDSGLSISYSAQPGTGAGLRVHVYIQWQKFHSGANYFGLSN